jgi:predicted transcriptional regulator
MNREQYIEMLKSGQFNIDINVLYEIYNQINRKSMFTFDVNTFYQLVREYVQVMGTNGVIETLKTYYDSKFKITYLYNKNQQIINIY